MFPRIWLFLTNLPIEFHYYFFIKLRKRCFDNPNAFLEISSNFELGNCELGNFENTYVKKFLDKIKNRITRIVERR